MYVRERAHTPGIQGKGHFSYGLPVIESPVDGFAVLIPRWDYLLYVDTFCIAPDGTRLPVRICQVPVADVRRKRSCRV